MTAWAFAGQAQPNPSRLNETLRAKLAGADRVRVLPMGVCCTRPEDMVPLLDTRDAEVVAALVAGIEVRWSPPGPSCLCCGGPCFEFYEGDSLVTRMTIHHWEGLRWPDGWRGDAVLTGRSLERIAVWLVERGAQAPEHLVARARRREALVRVLPAALAIAAAVTAVCVGLLYATRRRKRRAEPREQRGEARPLP